MTNGQDSNKNSELHQMQMGQTDSTQMNDLGESNEEYNEKKRTKPFQDLLDSFRPDIDKLLEE